MFMSYCRFENTLHEMRICMDVVGEHVNEEAEYPVSDGEIRYFRNMVEEMIDFLNEHALLDTNSNIGLDDIRLNHICDAMSKGYTDEEDDW